MAKPPKLALVFCIILCIIVSLSIYNQWSDLIKVQTNPALNTLIRHGPHIEQNNSKDFTDRLSPADILIPQDSELGRMKELSLMQIYLKYINMLQILCKDVIRVGSLKDGGKEICVDNAYKPRAPCLVYSFGINNQFDFDEAVVELFGCDVHCFDPSMKTDTRRMSEHIWFYKWGLGGKTHTNVKKWDIKTLDTIRRELGHSNRTIDILKIDIEGDEWNAIPQMISSGALDDVRQISMETHFAFKTSRQKKYWGDVDSRKQLSALRQLYEFGYRIFMRERNLFSWTKWPGIKDFITNVYEISMIKSF